MSNASLAAIPLPGIALGANKLEKAYLGTVKVWERPQPVQSGFDLFGWLFGWINELIPGAADALGGIANALFATPLGWIINGVEAVVGAIVGFIPGMGGQAGTLVSVPSTAQADASSAAGFINGIPIIGDIVGDLLAMLEGFTGLGAITSLLGAIPIVGSLGRLIGLFPSDAGVLAAPTNFVVNTAGQVQGHLSNAVYTASPAQAVNFMPAISGGMARMVVPPGLMSLPTQTARMRYSDGLTPTDDGYLQVTVGIPGDPGMGTQVFRRYSNDGTTSNGVGIDLRSSQLSIVRRVGRTDTVVAPCGSFDGGDVLRLEQAADTHTLYRNGVQAGQWVDASATAARNASHRSVAMVMQARQELAGARQFSPALFDVEAA